MAIEVGQEIYVPRRVAQHSEIAGREGRIALTRWGPADSTPIVLLHGWMDCGAAWQLLVDCLPDEWALIALDWPGYGRSAPRADHYWFPEHLAELEWLLDEVSPNTPARVIGHSMGGTVASMYAGIRAARLRWLVNLEGYGMPALAPEHVPGLIAGWLDALRASSVARRYSSLAELVSILRRANPQLPAAHAHYLARVWTRECEGGFQMRADPRQMLRTPIRYGRAELEACWAQVRTPTLLLQGEHSTHLRNALGPDGLTVLRQLMPSLRCATIAGAGHLLPYEQPQSVAQAIVRFVSTVA